MTNLNGYDLEDLMTINGVKEPFATNLIWDIEKLIEQGRTDTLKAVREAIGKDELPPEIPQNDYYWRIRNEYRAKLRQALTKMESNK